MKRNVRMWVSTALLSGLCVSAAVSAPGGPACQAAPAAERLAPPKLIELAGQGPATPGLREALITTLGENRIKNGTAVTGEGPSFIWAIESSSPPQLIVDDQPRPAMTQMPGTDLSSPSRSARQRARTSASGLATAAKTWRTSLEAGRSRISRWPTR